MRHARTAIWLAAAVAAVLSAAGCGGDFEDRTGLRWVGGKDGKWFAPAPTPQQRVQAALNSPNADERREAIVWLSDRRRCSLPSVVELFTVAVAKDADPTVRSAAARGLGRSVSPAAVAPLIGALEDPNRFVRLDATAALDGKEDDNVKRALLVRLARDEEPQVRAAAATALDRYRERRVLETLIASLRDRDFSVNYAAEQSLIRMTGQTHRYDPDAWNRWLATVGESGDPFAAAGQTPPSLQTTRAPLGERMRGAMRDAWFWWQADEKAPE